jgi:hypothetical protein
MTWPPALTEASIASLVTGLLVVIVGFLVTNLQG